MTRWPTFSTAAETTTPPQTSGLSAPRPSPPGPTSPASPWLHNHAYRRASLSPSRLPSICNAKLTVPFEHLRGKPDLSEVNFWAPSGRSFRALTSGEVFLFRLHAPYRVIVGGGVFV